MFAKLIIAIIITIAAALFEPTRSFDIIEKSNTVLYEA